MMRLLKSTLFEAAKGECWKRNFRHSLRPSVGTFAIAMSCILMKARTAVVKVSEAAVNGGLLRLRKIAGARVSGDRTIFRRDGLKGIFVEGGK
jgi:hypothetical protein